MIKIQPASAADMIPITNFIHEFVLDDIGLDYKQFVVGWYNDSIIGFGRLRQHPDALELCSLGVSPNYRLIGLGKLLIHELIKKAGSNTLYVACIIPDFFYQFGFREVAQFPNSLQGKINYCTNTLGSNSEFEKYVVMKKDNY